MTDTAPNPDSSLRAKERVIKRLAENGMSETEIAWRFRRSPGHIQRTLRLIDLPRESQDSSGSSGSTALERTVLKARNRGSTHAEIGARLRRSPSFVARVEEFAALRTERGFAG